MRCSITVEVKLAPLQFADAQAGADPDIRYLDRTEVEALLRAVPADVLGPTDAVLYLTAVMTGLRQGELAALRWRDVDWTAAPVRVRRNYTRGQWGTPKSRRSSRAVPMADRLAAELERHFQRSAIRAMTTSCSLIRTPDTPTTPPRCVSGSRRRSCGPRSARSAFTTCATPTARRWRRRALRYARSRSGWATRTTRRPRSTRTSRRTRRKARGWPRSPSGVPIGVPT